MTKKKEQIKEAEVKEIPQDLQDKISALRAIALTHKLLNTGTFTLAAHEGIKQSIAFLTALHEQLIVEAQNHPSADLVPELNTNKEG